MVVGVYFGGQKWVLGLKGSLRWGLALRSGVQGGVAVTKGHGGGHGQGEGGGGGGWWWVESCSARGEPGLPGHTAELLQGLCSRSGPLHCVL